MRIKRISFICMLSFLMLASSLNTVMKLGRATDNSDLIDKVGTISFESNPTKFIQNSDILFVALENNSIIINNISDPVNIFPISQIELNESILALHFDPLSLVLTVSIQNTGIILYNMSSFMSPDILTIFPMEEDIIQLAAEGNLIFGATNSTLYLLNSTISTNLEVISHVDNLSANSLEIDFPFLYIADANHGFMILNISNVEEPVIIGQIGEEINGLDFAVDIENNITYLAAGSEGMIPILFENRSDPGIIDNYTLFEEVSGLEQNGTFLFLSLGEEGMGIYEVDNPGYPRFLSYISNEGYLTQISVKGNYVFALNTEAIDIFDCSLLQDLNGNGLSDQSKIILQSLGFFALIIIIVFLIAKRMTPKS